MPLHSGCPHREWKAYILARWALAILEYYFIITYSYHKELEDGMQMHFLEGIFSYLLSCCCMLSLELMLVRGHTSSYFWKNWRFVHCAHLPNISSNGETPVDVWHGLLCGVHRAGTVHIDWLRQRLHRRTGLPSMEHHFVSDNHDHLYTLLPYIVVTEGHD